MTCDAHFIWEDVELFVCGSAQQALQGFLSNTFLTLLSSTFNMQAVTSAAEAARMMATLGVCDDASQKGEIKAAGAKG